MSDGAGRPLGRIALTFDAEHPGGRDFVADGASALLDVLEESSIRATFFLEGRWAEANPDVARRIAESGHLIGNHSYWHADLRLLTVAGRTADIEKAELSILSACSVDPRPWFRCPYGAGANDARVLSGLQRKGYRHVGWDIAPGDWDAGRTTDQVLGSVFDQVQSSDVILLHTWPTVTVAALPDLVRGLAARRAEFVTIAELPADELPGALSGSRAVV
jgi:peptidoglycan/xylan/chitin deacetylase (PgdA/CDA1 family)